MNFLKWAEAALDSVDVQATEKVNDIKTQIQHGEHADTQAAEQLCTTAGLTVSPRLWLSIQALLSVLPSCSAWPRMILLPASAQKMPFLALLTGVAAAMRSHQ